MSIEAEVAALKKVPMLKGVDAAKLKLLAFISERMVFRSGEALCRQGETGDRAFIILEGKADVVVNTPDGEKTVATVGKNDIVGEIAIICDVPRTASVLASDEVHALTVSKDHFFKLMREFPDIALEIMRVLAARLERTTRDLADVQGQLDRAVQPA
ncbi:MAG: cyclic nucleotide-binding domain-containing protein [Pseudomonadota bacterium]